MNQQRSSRKAIGLALALVLLIGCRPKAEVVEEDVTAAPQAESLKGAILPDGTKHD
jgi:hypothetical protein